MNIAWIFHCFLWKWSHVNPHPYVWDPLHRLHFLDLLLYWNKILHWCCKTYHIMLNFGLCKLHLHPEMPCYSGRCLWSFRMDWNYKLHHQKQPHLNRKCRQWKSFQWQKLNLNRPHHHFFRQYCLWNYLLGDNSQYHVHISHLHPHRPGYLWKCLLCRTIPYFHSFHNNRLRRLFQWRNCFWRKMTPWLCFWNI